MPKEQNKKSGLYHSIVLVVDDDKDVCDQVAEIVEGEGFLVACASNGAQAKKMVQEADVDIVLLDLQLPDVFGLDLVKDMREAKKDIAIIVLTGHASLDSAAMAVKQHIFDYIIKPYKPEEMLKIVKRAAEKQALEREVAQRMDTLERFRKISTGRELKMIELKEEIEKLRKKIKLTAEK